MVILVLLKTNAPYISNQALRQYDCV